MGYTDAYGNTVQEREPEVKKPRQRLRPGAYGSYTSDKSVQRSLPNVENGPPLWNF